MNSNTPLYPPPPPSSDPELMAFLIAPTPRRDIPAKLLRETYAQISPASRLCTAIFSIASGIFLCALTLFLLTPFAILRDRSLSKKHATAPGVVVSVTEAGGFLSGSRKTLYEIGFKFVPANAEGTQIPEAAGICYTNEERWKKGDLITVEYNPENIAAARAQGARLAKIEATKGSLSSLLMLFAAGPFSLVLGMLIAKKHFKDRAHARWLLANGTVDEFLIVDFDIVQQEKNKPLLHVYHLKPANKPDDRHAYFSQFTKENQIDYADAVRRSKSTTFGLYAPAANGGRRHVLVIEAWFHGVAD
jgi:hypothetical protein